MYRHLRATQSVDWLRVKHVCLRVRCVVHWLGQLDPTCESDLNDSGCRLHWYGLSFPREKQFLSAVDVSYLVTTHYRTYYR